MTHVITRPCIATCDTACVDVCPVECIEGPISVSQLRAVDMESRAAQFPSTQLFINPDECICCGACLPECPVGAIYDESDVPEEFADDIARNANFFEQRALRA